MCTHDETHYDKGGDSQRSYEIGKLVGKPTHGDKPTVHGLAGHEEEDEGGGLRGIWEHVRATSA